MALSLFTAPSYHRERGFCAYYLPVRVAAQKEGFQVVSPIFCENLDQWFIVLNLNIIHEKPCGSSVAIRKRVNIDNG